MYRYAQIDSDGYVISDSHLSGEVIRDNLIPISDDFDLSNKRYIDGEWKEYTPKPPKVEMTDEELTQLQTYLDVEYLVSLQEIYR